MYVSSELNTDIERASSLIFAIGSKWPSLGYFLRNKTKDSQKTALIQASNSV